MISSIIRWSIKNRTLVVLLSVIIGGIGLVSLKNTPVDAIPDLSDVQVIVKTSYPGQAPNVVQDQVTFPLSTAFMSVPGAKTVRGFSFFGDSYVYIIFEDKTDIYWARSRVLEYLSQLTALLPESATPQIGPDATGVGWVYMYALTDTSSTYDLSQLRSLQDWFLKFELQSIEGVSEVATIGGMEKQYQVQIHPDKLRAFKLPLAHIEQSIKRSNSEVGASVIEMAEAEYMVRVSGYIKSITDLENVPLGINENGTPLLLKNVANISLGPKMRRAVADLNGEGEAVGGVIVMRAGENAKEVIDKVKAKLEDIKANLPDGIEIIPVYDRSNLIKNAVSNLNQKLIEELVVVSLVCIAFLMHVRSALVALVSLPLGVLIAFAIMNVQGVNANIMSLGGIAVAIGAMVDGAIVMVENYHRHLSEDTSKRIIYWDVSLRASLEVGPSIFYGLLIITVSFLPVFMLEAQEGRLFKPLAYTKTYAMAAAALLSITLVPVLLALFIRRKKTLNKNRVITKFQEIYASVLLRIIEYPKTLALVCLLALLSALWPIMNIGSEFMPDMDEGDLMYMPSTYPGVSIGEARAILQRTNKLIKSLPEVKTVYGKVGRAETATDPAPLTMVETFIQFKPKHQWREGMTKEKIITELDKLINFPGLANVWVMPIKTRIDMLATGVKTPLGIKVSGENLDTVQSIAREIENLVTSIEGTSSVYTEQVKGARYLDIDLDRQRAARHELTIQDVQKVLSLAVGGAIVDKTTEGLERYTINLRYPDYLRNSPEALNQLPIVTKQGHAIKLSDVATIKIKDGPPVIKSENARPHGWVLVDISDRDIGSYVSEAKKLVKENITLPVGYSVDWSGQFEYLARAEKRFSLAIPLTLALIIVLLFLNFKSLNEVIIIIATLPFSIVGSVWFLYWFEYNLSVAVGVGMIALAGIAVETGILMLVYLKKANIDYLKTHKEKLTKHGFREAIVGAACYRFRPIIMTASATIAGLIPIFIGQGTGSEVMSRLAAPMIGGMISTVILTLLILPCLYCYLGPVNTNKTASVTPKIP